MVARIGPVIDKVTRLTQAGRVGEATTLIKRLVGIGLGPDRSPITAPPANGVRRDGNVPFRGVSRPGDLGSIARRTGLADFAEPRSSLEAPQPGSFTVRSVTNRAGSRRYKLYVPKAYTGQKLPLVVMLHGCTQSPDDFAKGTQMNAVADEHMALVAYPEQTRSANASKCWNWFEPGHQHRDAGEPSLVAAMVADVMRDLAVDRGKVFVAGLSAGGAAAAVMAHEYPDLFAGAGVHSGLACGAARNLSAAMTAMGSGAPGSLSASGRPVPTIIFHGESDHTVNPLNAGHMAEQAIGGGVTPMAADEIQTGRSAGGIAFTRTVRRDARCRALAEIWMLEGIGHAWSGGSTAGSYTDPRGPDASREMMRFFLGL